MLACVLTKTYSTKFTILDLLSPHNWRKKNLRVRVGARDGFFRDQVNKQTLLHYKAS